VHLVGFTTEIYHDARPYKCQVCTTCYCTEYCRQL